MSDELRSPSLTAVSAAAARRLEQVRALMKRETESQGDNVKPLAQLKPNDTTIETMLRISDDIIEQLRAARMAGSEEALVVGIVGSVGAGKSTFAQVLKLLLRSSACLGAFGGATAATTAAPPRAARRRSVSRRLFDFAKRKSGARRQQPLGTKLHGRVLRRVRAGQAKDGWLQRFRGGPLLQQSDR